MRIGITGHQRLKSDAKWSWVTSVIREYLVTIPPPIVGITSLAIGADQLFARSVLDLGGSLIAVLPFSDIERTFTPADIPAFRELLSRSSVETLEPRANDQDSYLAAGRRVADIADIVIAVWDGLPAKGPGGTADAVQYAITRSVPLMHINPDRSTVSWITSGR